MSTNILSTNLTAIGPKSFNLFLSDLLDESDPQYSGNHCTWHYHALLSNLSIFYSLPTNEKETGLCPLCLHGTISEA